MTNESDTRPALKKKTGLSPGLRRAARVAAQIALVVLGQLVAYALRRLFG